MCVYGIGMRENEWSVVSGECCRDFDIKSVLHEFVLNQRSEIEKSEIVLWVLPRFELLFGYVHLY
jgi:hypothetical protein